MKLLVNFQQIDMSINVKKSHVMGCGGKSGGYLEIILRPNRRRRRKSGGFHDRNPPQAAGGFNRFDPRRPVGRDGAAFCAVPLPPAGPLTLNSHMNLSNNFAMI